MKILKNNNYLYLICLLLTFVFTPNINKVYGFEKEVKKLIIGTKPAPPFSFKGPGGNWLGISIDLFRDISKELGFTYELREYDLKGLLNAVEYKDVDMGVAAITITPEREKKFDFSHAFYHTGLGIAIKMKQEGNPIFSIIVKIFSVEFFTYVGALFFTLFIIGIIIWAFERKKNPSQFRPGIKGLADGFWWSAVTMTTVGYGDAVPKSFFGRIVGLVWMFLAIIIISFFTAGITSSLTISQLDTSIKNFDDLRGVLVGSVDKSAAGQYLEKKDIMPKYYKSLLEGMKALNIGEIDAMVHDRPILQFYANIDFKGKIIVLNTLFNPQSYGIAMPAGSNLREPLNNALLKRWMNEDYWDKLTGKYLGR